jgi:hypothetical protein
MIGTGYLSDCVKVTKLADHATAATSAVTSASIDMAGWDGVLFATSYGTAAANNKAVVHQSDDDSSFAATVAEKASGTSDEDVLIDVQKPLKRYLKVVAARGTSSTLESIWAIQYRGRSLPVNNATSGTSAVGQFASPAAA